MYRFRGGFASESMDEDKYALGMYMYTNCCNNVTSCFGVRSWTRRLTCWIYMYVEVKMLEGLLYQLEVFSEDISGTILWYNCATKCMRYKWYHVWGSNILLSAGFMCTCTCYVCWCWVGKGRNIGILGDTLSGCVTQGRPLLRSLRYPPVHMQDWGLVLYM